MWGAGRISEFGEVGSSHHFSAKARKLVTNPSPADDPTSTGLSIISSFSCIVLVMMLQTGYLHFMRYFDVHLSLSTILKQSSSIVNSLNEYNYMTLCMKIWISNCISYCILCKVADVFSVVTLRK